VHCIASVPSLGLEGDSSDGRDRVRRVIGETLTGDSGIISGLDLRDFKEKRKREMIREPDPFVPG
jgi:hypothetical protein